MTPITWQQLAGSYIRELQFQSYCDGGPGKSYGNSGDLKKVIELAWDSSAGGVLAAFHLVFPLLSGKRRRFPTRHEVLAGAAAYQRMEEAGGAPVAAGDPTNGAIRRLQLRLRLAFAPRSLTVQGELQSYGYKYTHYTIGALDYLPY